MEPISVPRRLPRAGVDSIDDATTALSTIGLALHRPLRHETIVLVLDETRRGRTIVVVSDTHQPDAVVEVVECITQGEGSEHVGAIVVASVRPAGAIVSSAEHGSSRAECPDIDDLSDIDRWLEMSEIASLAGIELLEWFVIGRSVSCPRDHLGEAPRW